MFKIIITIYYLKKKILPLQKWFSKSKILKRLRPCIHNYKIPKQYLFLWYNAPTIVTLGYYKKYKQNDTHYAGQDIHRNKHLINNVKYYLSKRIIIIIKSKT